ncbi:hypothetical protein PFISCL1PPCAC_1483, partial [Pristionchus fissidentatus]
IGKLSISHPLHSRMSIPRMNRFMFFPLLISIATATTTVSSTTPATTTDNTIPCGDTRCHPAWTCNPHFFFCVAPRTLPPPECGEYYCNNSETCETIRVLCKRAPCPADKKVCVLKEGATTSSPTRCNDLLCPPNEVCMAVGTPCSRLPCPTFVKKCVSITSTTNAPTTQE